MKALQDTIHNSTRNAGVSVVEYIVKEFDITLPFQRTRDRRAAHRHNHASPETQSAFFIITIIDFTGRRPRSAA